MLNDFRNVDVIWDKATKNFVKKIRVASSDERGRKLTVQVVNGGQVENLTGSTLSLYWITENKEHQGLDGFTQVDATQGIFEIFYTTEMLGNIGKLRANLHLIDEIGAVSSEQFYIEVFRGIDSEAVQSNDSFSALTQALAEVQTIKEDEAERVSAEAERATAEEERVSNENERKTAETTRNTNETTRVSNETDRVNAEDTRKTNETNRVDAESGRVTAETERITAEEERKQGYPALDGRITAVEGSVDSLGFKNVKSRFTIKDNAVTNFSAYQQGNIYILKFKYKPASTGFNEKIIVPDFSVGGQWPASVATTDTAEDLTKGIGGYWGSGGVTLTVPSLPSYPLIFQFVAIY